MAALHGDESRLPVFDLDGDGVHSVLHATKGDTWCVNAKTSITERSAREAVGDIIVGQEVSRHDADGDGQDASGAVSSTR